MTFVSKISKPGYDVLNASNKDLLFNAANATHSIFNIVSVTMTGLSSSLSHGLNYVPKVWIYMVDSDVGGTFYRRIPSISENTFKVDYYVTDTSVVIERNATPSNLSLKVIIFTRSPNV